METIIYFYRRAGATDFETEKWQEEDYCLIRAGVPSFVWQLPEELKGAFERRTEPPWEAKGKRILQSSEGLQEESKRRPAWKNRKEETAEGIWKQICGRERRRKRSERKLQVEKRQMLKQLTCCVEEWQTALLLLSDNANQVSCVYEESLRRELERESAGRIWTSGWRVPEFADYRDLKWMQKLMRCGTLEYYLVLGTTSCLPELLYAYARQMRGVRWLLVEEAFSLEIQEFLEDFYQETGLVIETEIFGDRKARGWMCPQSRIPVNVLDFSGEERLSACGVPSGSIWLDMDSLEEKSRRLEARNPGVCYFSMKKEWRQRQKEPRNLDTIGKNGYNT